MTFRASSRASNMRDGGSRCDTLLPEHLQGLPAQESMDAEAPSQNHGSPQQQCVRSSCVCNLFRWSQLGRQPVGRSNALPESNSIQCDRSIIHSFY